MGGGIFSALDSTEETKLLVATLMLAFNSRARPLRSDAFEVDVVLLMEAFTAEETPVATGASLKKSSVRNMNNGSHFPG